jgi:hypothetical protein
MSTAGGMHQQPNRERLQRSLLSHAHVACSSDSIDDLLAHELRLSLRIGLLHPQSDRLISTAGRQRFPVGTPRGAPHTIGVTGEGVQECERHEEARCGPRGARTSFRRKCAELRTGSGGWNGLDLLGCRCVCDLWEASRLTLSAISIVVGCRAVDATGAATPPGYSLPGPRHLRDRRTRSFSPVCHP